MMSHLCGIDRRTGCWLIRILRRRQVFRKRTQGPPGGIRQGDHLSARFFGFYAGIMMAMTHAHLPWQYKNKVFKVAQFDRWLVIVSGTKLVDEIRKATDNELSFSEAANDVCTHSVSSHYMMDFPPSVNTNGVHARPKYLPRSISRPSRPHPAHTKPVRFIRSHTRRDLLCIQRCAALTG